MGFVLKMSIHTGWLLWKENELSVAVCYKCKIEMQPKETVFQYLGRSIKHDVPVCPICGQIYIGKDIVEGRMTEVEQLMEDK